jgi:hypothetical protein
MKKTYLLLINILLVLTFTACASFHETYKPLYQVKPEVTSLKGQ